MGEGSRPPHHTLPGSARPGRCPYAYSSYRAGSSSEGAVGVAVRVTVVGNELPSARMRVESPAGWAMSPPLPLLPHPPVNPD